MKQNNYVPSPRPTARSLRVGDMVVCPDGQIGILDKLEIFSASYVMLGAAGPTLPYSWKDLRLASADEILDAGLDGIGCNQMSEVRAASRKRQRKTAHA